MKSLLFLGKFDENMYFVEEKVLNMNEKPDPNQSFKIKINYNPSLGPDLKAIIHNNCKFLFILGDFKPNIQLQKLISKTEIILFIFNLTKFDSLTYLKEDWGKIIQKIDKVYAQKRILIGTECKSGNYSTEQIESIFNVMDILKCDAYYEEGSQIKTASTHFQNKKYLIITNLIEYIQNQLSNENCDTIKIKYDEIKMENTDELIFQIILENEPKKLEEAKDIILQKFKMLNGLRISISDLEKTIFFFDSNKDNDKVNDYIKQITADNDDLNFKNCDELLIIYKSYLKEAKPKLKKLQKLNPLVSFLSKECNKYLNDSMNKLIEEILNLQKENEIVRKIIDFDKEDKPIKKLFNIDSAYTLPSNVFYRFSIKKLFNNSEIKSLDSLFDIISNIKQKTHDLINIQMIKEMKVQEFKEEIIQKTHDLIKFEIFKTEHCTHASNLIYQRIESNYQKFSKLSNDDKKYMQKIVFKIIHFDDFIKLGSFFEEYFKTRVTNPEKINCIMKILKKDDKIIQKFQNFSSRNNDKLKFQKAKTKEISNIEWPEFDDVNIQRASQFFTFWNCIIQIISLHINNNDSLLLTQLCSFLDDKNAYIQFLKRMQQAYIEPNCYNLIIIFESIMKMLNASDITNNKADFMSVSKNAATYFVNNPSEFHKVTNGIDTLIKKEKQIAELFSNNEAIDEYGFIKRVVDKELTWKISFKDHIQLMNKGKVEADYIKLRLIAAKLDISMIKMNNSTNLGEFKNLKDFVQFFQTAESLYEKLSILHKLNFEIGDKEITHNSLDSKDLQQLINNIDNIIQAINEIFLKVYTDSISLFTKEQFFKLCQLLNEYSKKKEKSKDFVSIFEGTIISTYISRKNTPIDDYYRLIKDNFKAINFNDDFSITNFKDFEDNLTNFSEILRKIIATLFTEENKKKIDEYSIHLEAKRNLNDYLEGETVRFINLNTIRNEKNEEISSKYQLHSMILYLLKLYRSNDSMPLPTQILICSTSTTLSQIESFLGYFYYMLKNKNKYMFIVTSPIQLQPSLYDFLITKLKEIRETTISQSRIVILFENEDLTKKDIFKEFIRNNDVDSFKPICNTEQLKNLYKIQRKSCYGIQAYYTYEQYPRTGKTHTILKHIHKEYPNHIYTRIHVDEFTTLTTLINHLNELHKVDYKDKHIIIHFNVDIKCNTNFHLYIQNLAFFRSLNDGISIPFLANNQMVFYFEFESFPSLDKSEFIQNVFPIAEYIEEIKIEQNTDEFFTYDEYHPIPHDEIFNTLMIIKREKYRTYLIDAATIVRLNQDEALFMTNDKNEYIDKYLQFYNELENNPKLAYKYLLEMFKDIKNNPKEIERSKIAQIGDISKIISKFKGPIVREKTYGYHNNYVRKFMSDLLIDAAITNCGIPYIPQLNDKKVVENLAKAEDRINIIKEYIFAICDPSGSQEEQIFTLICNESNILDILMKKFKCFDDGKKKYTQIKCAIESAINVIDLERKLNQISSDKLFEILSNILNLQKYNEEKYSIAMILYLWISLQDETKKSLEEEWKKYIDSFKKNVRDNGLKEHVHELDATYHAFNDDPEFKKKKKFWNIVQDQIIKQNSFDISIIEDPRNNENTIFVSNDIHTFISNCEKYIQNKESLIFKYTLTPQNIKIIIHLIYCIYSNVPIILTGETGSGKTFTLKFLSEMFGSNIKLIKYVFSEKIREEDFRTFLRSKIKEIELERSKMLKAKLRAISEDKTIPIFLADIIKSLPIDKKDEDILYDFKDISNRATKFIANLSMKDLSKYDVSNETEREVFISKVISNLAQKFENVQKIYLFFFDECNTAPCQWLIKEVILDRYFEGKILSEDIRFVCAVNPSRKMKKSFVQKSLDIIDPKYNYDSQDKVENLVYKVYQMPESFVPYLFSVDSSREYGSFSLSKNAKIKSDDDYLFDVNINSEFDANIEKKVKNEFSFMTYQFITQNIESNDNIKEGDKHHFSLTNMFSTSFDYFFFYNLTSNSQDSILYEIAISNIVSRINIFCCRFLYKVIYKDESFSSIRDPERCIRIMRWAYKFGIFENLQDHLNFEEAIERLRKAFIIGLSASFWIRLSDQPQKDKKKKDSERKMFIDSVCEYWQKVLKELEFPKIIKQIFKAPNYDEWMGMISNECKQYADIFVDEEDCVSKNKALSENIWVSFICIMNKIPLWIIGESGTSKSLALNIVINKLMCQNSTNEKITRCPPIVQQTFMCSSTTTTEAIMCQLEKIVDRSILYKDNYVIRILILENIDHADMSLLKPLSCLHNIIDNGFTVSPGISVPVQIIGLSNYKMDSAKLNRGVLLLRCSLNEDEIKQTAFEIFKSTNIALNPDATEGTKKYKALYKYKDTIEEIGKEYQNIYESLNKTSEKPFMGLRDFYGLIQSITNYIVNNSNSQQKILTIIRRNYSGIPYSLDNLDNEKTTEIIKSTMKIIFPDQEFDKYSHFKKLVCPITAPEYMDKEEEDIEKILENDIEHSTVYYDMTKLIRANFNQEHRLLKTPTFRHILISTVNAAAFFILVQNEYIKFTNYDNDSPYEFFFSNNMTNISDAEWISNELKRLIKIMYEGKKTAIFIGRHPCFDSLYDVFNLRYQKESGRSDDEEHDNFVANISYGGDSYPIIVNSNFKCIIILESNIYKDLPQSFLDRFEKFNLTYKTELLEHHHEYSRECIKSLKKKLQKDPSFAFGCYSDELLLSIYHTCETADEIDPNDLLLLSIHPADLIYSIKNDISFDDEEIISALKENSNFRSSVAHLLDGYYDDCSGDDTISDIFYKKWKKNKGIKSIIMVPSFNNINKITGYDFIKIDPSNSINIESRFKDEIQNINEKTKLVKKPNPIVLAILISEGKFTVYHILQYEYTLDTIRRWCKDELRITNRQIHTLIIISMEHKIKDLKINQSTEWPLLYLDTCYDDTIITKNNKGLPLSLKQIVFTPLRTLLAEEIIDLESIIQLARKSIQHCYTREENELIDKLIFNHENNYKTYIFDFIKSLIKGKENDNDYDNSDVYEKNCTRIETISDDFQDLWSINKITYLSSPPSSLIQYLSLKLVDAIGSVMSAVFGLLLSGINPSDIDDVDQNIFHKSDIFYYLLYNNKYKNIFYSIFNSDSTTFYPIDYRYYYEVKLPGQLFLYKFIWQTALNINDRETIKDSDSLFEKVKPILFEKDQKDTITNVFDEIMETKLSSNETSPSFTFIAAYLLVIADSVHVDRNHYQSFIYWICSFIEILKGLYNNKTLTMQFIMYILVNNKELVDFAHNFTISFMFFPYPITKNIRMTQSILKSKLKNFYNELVPEEIKKSINDNGKTTKMHIDSEAAYLITQKISKDFDETINKLNIDIIEAIKLFKNEFLALLAIHNSLIFNGEFIKEGYNYIAESKYFQFIMVIQKFFYDYGDIILKKINIYGIIEFHIKFTNDGDTKKYDFSKIENVEKFISYFVKDYFKKTHINETIDEDRAISSLTMCFYEAYYNVYFGMIDNFENDEEGNEEEGNEKEEEDSDEI